VCVCVCVRVPGLWSVLCAFLLICELDNHPDIATHTHSPRPSALCHPRPQEQR
jgi:hypothetical protein